MTQSQSEARPQLVLLSKPSRAARRAAVQAVRDVGARVVAQYGEVAIEARLNPKQAESLDAIGLFAARLLGPMGRESFNRLGKEQQLYVRQWNSRFRPDYRELTKRPPNRGISWGAEGRAAPWPHVPIELPDFERLLEQLRPDVKIRLPRKTRGKGRATKRMSSTEFKAYEAQLRRKYKDERLAYGLARLAFRYGPEFKSFFLSLPPTLLEILIARLRGAVGGSCLEMTGRFAVGLVFVESSRSGGPKFSASERDDVCDEIIDGLNWLAEQHPTGNLSWIFDLQFVTVDVADQSGDPVEDYWRDPALGKISYQGASYSESWSGVGEYRDDLRTHEGTDDAFVIFVTPFNNEWHAYAGGGRITLADRKDWGGWGRGALDVIAAHEMAHLFGSADEYTGSGTPCSSCGGAHGCDGIPNGNCGSCAEPQQPCAMGENDRKLCAYTRGQIGWATLFVELTTADVDYAGTDDAVFLDIGDRSFELDTPDWDDRERGHVEGYAIYEPSLERSDVKRILIRKDPDGDYGGWRFEHIRVWFQGELVCEADVNEWLEDDRRFWVGCIRDRTLVNTLTVEITTADVNYAGTDDTVTLRLGGRSWHLNNVNRDDFERGNTDTFELDPDTSFYADDIHSIEINKSPDGSNGGWKLKGVKVIVNGSTLYDNQSINKWLEDDDRTWSDTI